MKVIVNRCFGGYGFSHEAIMLYAQKSGFPLYVKVSEFGGYDYFTDAKMDDESYWAPSDLRGCRTDPLLIEVVEELGRKADGQFARLEVVEIPDDVKWHIEEYDGSEHVAEDHRTW